MCNLKAFPEALILAVVVLMTVSIGVTSASHLGPDMIASMHYLASNPDPGYPREEYICIHRDSTLVPPPDVPAETDYILRALSDGASTWQSKNGQLEDCIQGF